MLWRILFLVGLWLLFECAISWFATCDQPSYYAAAYDGQKGHCTLFSGPLVSLIRFGLTGLLDFLHTYEKQLVAGFTVVLAIFTGTLWWSTNKLWKAGERQMELIERNAAQQTSDMQASVAVAQETARAAERNAEAAIDALRPWVGLHTNTHYHPGNAHDINAKAVVVNTGQSAAIDLRGKFVVKVTMPDESVPEIPSTVNCAPHPLFPNVPHTFHAVEDCDTVPLKPAEIGEGKIFVWLVGRLDYLDGEGNPHHTTICLRYWPAIDQFVPYDEGNEAT